MKTNKREVAAHDVPTLPPETLREQTHFCFRDHQLRRFFAPASRGAPRPVTWFFTGLALVLHLYLWGVGLTYFICPRRWLRYWWVFSPMAGLALQSAVVWTGAHTALRGTNSYGLASLLIPAALLAAAVWRLGSRRAWTLLLNARRCWGIWLIMLFALALQAYPLAHLSGELTSASLGSCDAADYAAGARVFQDFSANDRTGFLGQGGVTEVSGIDNFPVFWLRLNHFTPSALLALNGAIIHSRPHKLASLFGIVLAVLTLPVVFWLARSGFRMRPLGSLLVTFLYACSPVVAYGIYHCALGQLIAAPAVALLTWVGLKAFHGPRTVRHFAGYAALLVVCNWLILGAYNFFIIFSYVPLLAYVGCATLRTQRWGHAIRWTLYTAATLALTALLFPGRIVALVARLSLLQTNNYGWPIPPFGPSGWFGFFANSKLEPASSLLAQLLGAAGLIALAAAVFYLARRSQWRVILLAFSCTIPILAGYGILVWQGHQRGDNATYNAYKIFSVFLPGLLISFCLWFDLSRLVSNFARVRFVVFGALCAIVICSNLAMFPKFSQALGRAGLVVDHRMLKLATIEQMTDVRSLNVCFEVYWSRLWANYFLLRKPHYFQLPTYEGRLITAPVGDWDLREDFLNVPPLNESDRKQINRGYYLVNRRADTFLDARLSHGWAGADFTRSGPWAWGAASPQIELTNPHPRALKTVMQFSAETLKPGVCRLFAGEQLAWQGELGAARQTVIEFPVELPPGRTVLRFETATAQPAPKITLALHHFDIRIVEPEGSPPSR